MSGAVVKLTVIKLTLKMATILCSSGAISDLVLAEIQSHLDEMVFAFLSFQELLGNALCCHKKLRKFRSKSSILA